MARFGLEVWTPLAGRIFNVARGTVMTDTKQNASEGAQPDLEAPDNCLEWNWDGRSGHWSKIHGRRLLCSGPMSWAANSHELHSLERLARYGWEPNWVLREFTNQLFELIDVEYDLKELALTAVEEDRSIGFDQEKSHRECRRQAKRETVDTLCVLPITWSQHGVFDRLGRHGLSVSQVNRRFTDALYGLLTYNRHILHEALFALESNEFEAFDRDDPVWH